MVEAEVAGRGRVVEGGEAKAREALRIGSAGC